MRIPGCPSFGINRNGKNCWKNLNAAFFLTDFCVFGVPWRKRTRFFTNSSLAGEKLLCSCPTSARHIVLKGYSKQHGRPWTKVAESYPARLCTALALKLSDDRLPVSRRRRLDIAACAKCNDRIGEAVKPGPRPLRARPAVDLEEVQLLTTHTLVIQQRARQMFVSWLQDELSTEVFESLAARPDLCVVFLRAFGRFLYANAGPLYLFRHLVVYYQRNFPAFPIPLGDAWDLISKWERVQPVEHRKPMPKLVFDSMICLAWHWGWRRWAAVSLLAFHGKMRAREPLDAQRVDLLLPCETGASVPAAYLNIRKPKTRNRGKGVVQHAKICDDLALDAREGFYQTYASGNFVPCKSRNIPPKVGSVAVAFRCAEVDRLDAGRLAWRRCRIFVP